MSDKTVFGGAREDREREREEVWSALYFRRAAHKNRVFFQGGRDSSSSSSSSWARLLGAARVFVVGEMH